MCDWRGGCRVPTTPTPTRVADPARRVQRSSAHMARTPIGARAHARASRRPRLACITTHGRQPHESWRAQAQSCARCLTFESCEVCAPVPARAAIGAPSCTRAWPLMVTARVWRGRTQPATGAGHLRGGSVHALLNEPLLTSAAKSAIRHKPTQQLAARAPRTQGQHAHHVIHPRSRGSDRGHHPWSYRPMPTQQPLAVGQGGSEQPQLLLDHRS